MALGQRKNVPRWGKAPRFVRGLLESALDALLPPRRGARALRRMSAEKLFECSERATETQSGTVAVFAYRDPAVRRLVWELKYYSSPRAIRLAADSLATFLAEELSERALFRPLEAPLIVSIPASPSRTRGRGGDPLSRVAAQTARLLDSFAVTFEARVLYKLRDTTPQAETKSRAERLKNVVGSFAVRESAMVRGRNIIVLDDVTTTGATFKEARRALKAAGARRVLCVALAH